MVFCIHTVDASEAIVKPKEPFQLGVYLNAHRHPSNLPVSNMMAHLAAHGVTRVNIISKVYVQFAHQKLHSLAKDWGIAIYVSNVRDTSNDPEAQRRALETIRDLVDSHPDADAVVGWNVADEVEFALDPEKHPDAEDRLRAYVELARRVDPQRRVLVNHDARNQKWGDRFMRLGEDEPTCSVFFANHLAADHLRRVLAQFKESHRGQRPLFVYGGQSSNQMSAQSMATMGLKGGVDDVRRIKVREDIADYVLTSYRVGAAGTMFFVYDGYYDYHWYSLVDERGRSKEGKMEGILDAIRQIRHDEGWPSLTLKVTPSRRSLTIEVATQANQRPVESTHVQISFDGGYTWSGIEGFSAEGGTVEFRIPHVWQRPAWSLIRAHCFDGEHHSLWSVWNVFPAPRPNPS